MKRADSKGSDARDVTGAATGSGEVTALLAAWSGGDPSALERLLPLVYSELRRIARRVVAVERRDHTLEPTAVVHEAFLRLCGGAPLSLADRHHFFAVAARCMRRLLVDHTRRRKSGKRAGDLQRVTLLDADRAVEPASVDVMALDRALEKLARIDPDLERLVDLRFFGGLELTEVAEITGVSLATVKRELRAARAFLARELGAGPA